MVEIRDTCADDAIALKSALKAIWHDTYDGFLGADRVNELTSMWHQVERLEKEATSDNICSIVATQGDSIVGHAFAYLAEANEVHLARLYVDHALHGQGVGKRLLERSVGAFADAKSVRLEVYENNTRAMVFYQSQGFETVSRTRDSFTNDVLYELTMKKEVGLNV